MLVRICGAFVLLCVALFLLKYFSEPRFIERAMRQYKDFAFQKLTQKSISSFRDESTATYLSALTNDAASIESDDLAQQLSLITKTTAFFGALLMMLWYSPLLAGRRAALGLVDKLAEALEKNAASEGAVRLDGLARGIRLENVSFGYESGKDVLHGLSAKFRAGKAYAVVGGSGSGKSTLLHLLMAGSPDYRGSILVNNAELRDIAPESLYEIMSVIQQNVFVFNASIRDNVSMFRPFPQEALDQAIRHAHLSELIASRGSDYLCGENGCGLSGGPLFFAVPISPMERFAEINRI